MTSFEVLQIVDEGDVVVLSRRFDEFRTDSTLVSSVRDLQGAIGSMDLGVLTRLAQESVSLSLKGVEKLVTSGRVNEMEVHLSSERNEIFRSPSWLSPIVEVGTGSSGVPERIKRRGKQT